MKQQQHEFNNSMSKEKDLSAFKRLFLNEKLIFGFIILNCITLFVEGFHLTGGVLMNVVMAADYSITIVFLIEMIVKISTLGWRRYIKSHWNKLDFTLVMLSLPTIIAAVTNIEMIDLSILLVFRLLRAFRLLRLIEYVPGITGLLEGAVRALKTSVVVIIVFGIALFMLSIFSNFLFHTVSPDHFSNPLDSMYSIFKIFTVEGWFDIPDDVASNFSGVMKMLVRVYFVAILFVGGIIGLSLLNSVFVDAMVSDNNDDLENEVKSLKNEIIELKALIKQDKQG